MRIWPIIRGCAVYKCSTESRNRPRVQLSPNVRPHQPSSVGRYSANNERSELAAFIEGILLEESGHRQGSQTIQNAAEIVIPIDQVERVVRLTIRANISFLYKKERKVRPRTLTKGTLRASLHDSPSTTHYSAPNASGFASSHSAYACTQLNPTDCYFKEDQIRSY